MKSCRKRKPRDVQFPRVQFEKARCSGSGGFAAIALSISEIGLRTNGKARFGREFAVARRPLDGRTPRRPPAICYVRSTSTPAVRCAKTPRWCRFRLTRYLVLAGWKPSHSRPSIRFSEPGSHSVGRRDADKRNAYELALLRSASMYLPNFLDGFDRIVAFDAETTGKRTPDAEFVRKQPFAWRAPGIIIEVGFVEMLREGEGWRKGETWSSRVNPDGRGRMRLFVLDEVGERRACHAELHVILNMRIGGIVDLRGQHFEALLDDESVQVGRPERMAVLRLQQAADHAVGRDRIADHHN